MAVVSVSAHEVDAVAVLVPEGSLIRQSTVGDGDVVVVVVGGEGTSVVVGHGVPCRDNRTERGGETSSRRPKPVQLQTQIQVWIKGKMKGRNDPDEI